MAHESTYRPKSSFAQWFDARLPIPRLMHDQFMVFPTPRNLNYWWTFGGILTFMLIAQIATGIVLAMHYVPTPEGAFDSVEKIMRDVNWGWMLRYAHAVGASLFFLAVYIHTLRGLYYGSYKAPREVLWVLGVLILLLMIATAFMGYSLPWGQMSFWAVTVITNLFSSLDAVIPGLGTKLVEWIWGGFAVGAPTLNRLYSLHYLFPFIILGVVMLHVWALHMPGNNNPTGIEVKSARDTVPFHPYYTIKDGFALVLFIILFAGFVFYAPNFLGHTDNYIPANPLQTPPHIVPEWYFLPFYAILRAIPNKLLGVVGLIWLDRNPVLRAVARHLEGAVDALPADLQMVLLGVRGDLRRPRLSRRAGARGLVSVLRAAVHALLFRLLPRRDARDRLVRAAGQIAGQHHRIRSGAGARNARAHARGAQA